MVGRTLDLKSAYRQLLVAKTTSWVNNIMVWDPTQGRPAYFHTHALLFGTAASVMGFNRFARAIWQIGVNLFHLAWTNYVDDFPQLELSEEGGHGRRTAHALLGLLGWAVADGPEKDKGMDAVFQLLGVQLGLARLEGGILVVENTAKRVAELIQAAWTAKERGELLPGEALSLLGRLQFAEAQLFGRWGALMLGPIREIASRHSAGSPLRAEARQALGWVIEYLTDSRPRTLKRGAAEAPLVLFTDGAFEPVRGSASWGRIGGCIWDQQEGVIDFFGEDVPPDLLETWGEVGVSHAIAQVETLAVVVAFLIYSSRLLGRRAFVFIDNDGARASFIAMGSASPTVRDMLRVFAKCNRDEACYP